MDRRFLFAGIHLLLVSNAMPAPQEAPALIQQKLQEWIRLQKTYSREAADWNGEKQRLADLNAIRQQEIDQLDQLLARSETSRTKAAAEQAELDLRVQRLERQRQVLQTRIDALEVRLRPLLEKLPPPLKHKLAIREKTDTERPLQDRYRDLLSMLTEIGEFQNTVALDTELREIDAQRIEVDVLYLGLAQAWYVDRAGRHAGHGRSGAEGWVWTETPALASRVRSAIDMAGKQCAAGFIQLPLQLEGGAR